MDIDRKLRGKPLQLFCPVPDKRAGGDNKDRSVNLVLKCPPQERDHLNGLAQAHLVGQTAADSVAAEVLHPLDSIDLVGSEGALSPGCSPRPSGPGS